MSKQHTVTGALVIAKKDDGSDLYLYQGAVLPDTISDKEVARLTALGLVDGDIPETPPVATPKAKPAAESN